MLTHLQLAASVYCYFDNLWSQLSWWSVSVTNGIVVGSKVVPMPFYMQYLSFCLGRFLFFLRTADSYAEFILLLCCGFSF